MPSAGRKRKRDNSLSSPPKGFWTNEKVKELLKCVQSYRVLWDVNHEKYNCPKWKYYDQIALDLKIESSWCQLKFAALKYYFGVLDKLPEHHKSEITWPYYENCQFMAVRSDQRCPKKLLI